MSDYVKEELRNAKSRIAALEHSNRYHREMAKQLNDLVSEIKFAFGESQIDSDQYGVAHGYAMMCNRIIAKCGEASDRAAAWEESRYKALMELRNRDINAYMIYMEIMDERP